MPFASYLPDTNIATYFLIKKTSKTTYLRCFRGFYSFPTVKDGIIALHSTNYNYDRSLTNSTAKLWEPILFYFLCPIMNTIHMSHSCHLLSMISQPRLRKCLPIHRPVRPDWLNLSTLSLQMSTI